MGAGTMGGLGRKVEDNSFLEHMDVGQLDAMQEQVGNCKHEHSSSWEHQWRTDAIVLITS